MHDIMKSKLSYKIDAVILCAALLIAFTGIFFMGETKSPLHASSDIQNDRASALIENSRLRCQRLLAEISPPSKLDIDGDFLKTPSGAIAFAARDPRRPNEIAALVIDYSGNTKIGKPSFATADGRDLLVLRQNNGVFVVEIGNDQSPTVQILAEGVPFEILYLRSPPHPKEQK
jgi:hypothetical protein